ncbi:MAG: Ig domain-containing protein, partial [Gallionellaceae bacterium]|nr:Ig domain-containing protein [Gallionellaceae bacterium]
MKQIIFFLLLFAFHSIAQASTAYGDLNNFDVVNDTGQECHGFEIELDDIHSTDVTYTYDWNHYGTPSIREDNSDPAHPKVYIRHASLKDALGNYTAYTSVPTTSIAPTDGHQCTNTAVNEGCEHFGVGYSANPSSVKYNWLIDDGAGNLIQGPAVNIATPTWTYYPPVAGVQDAQVQAVIAAPPVPPVVVKEFGDAVWVKEIRTTAHSNNRVELKDLVSDDPNVANDKNWKNGEPDEVEVEWQIQQTEFANPGGANNELAGAPEALPVGDEVVTRRYEFFKYIGGFQDTNEVMCDKWTDTWTVDAITALKAECLDPADPSKPLQLVGDYIGAQMAGFNVVAPLGLIDNIQGGNMAEPYPDRTIVVGGNTPYVTTVTAGVLPDGLSIDPATGVLSGMPVACGTFIFTVDATDADAVHVSKDYTVKIMSADGCPLAIADGSMITGEVGVPISSITLISGGLPAYIIDTAGGDPLPAGLSINAATGMLTGTPTQAGVANVALDVIDATPAQNFGTFSVNIAAAVAVAPIVLPSGTTGTAYASATLTASNGVAPYSWAISAGALPAGLSLNTSTGKISGTPTAT